MTDQEKKDQNEHSVEPIRRTISVPVSAERAFTVFTDLGKWWPQEYTWAGEVLDTIGIEPHQGGHCFERGPHQFECDWGRVLVWEPPRRLVLAWQISPARMPEPNPAKASEVELRFVAEGSSTTRLEFEHRGFARHGKGGPGYRAALDSAEGWTYILNCFLAAVA